MCKIVTLPCFLVAAFSAYSSRKSGGKKNAASVPLDPIAFLFMAQESLAKKGQRAFGWRGRRKEFYVAL